MNTARADSLRHMRFIAANYTRLQGLRGLPFFLALFAVTFWANRQTGPAPRPILPPLLLAVGFLALAWPISRYYQQAFGRVEIKPRLRKWMDWIINAGGGIVCLAAFLADTYLKLPFSMLGLALALAFLVDYLLTVHFTEYWYMPFWPVFPALITLVSLLPQLGAGEWWKLFGIHAQMLGVVMAASLVMMIASVVSHGYFAGRLPGEGTDGRRI